MTDLHVRVLRQVARLRRHELLTAQRRSWEQTGQRGSAARVRAAEAATVRAGAQLAAAEAERTHSDDATGR